jgi:hypothetical protein
MKREICWQLSEEGAILVNAVVECLTFPIPLLQNSEIRQLFCDVFDEVFFQLCLNVSLLCRDNGVVGAR